MQTLYNVDPRQQQLHLRLSRGASTDDFDIVSCETFNLWINPFTPEFLFRDTES